MRTEIITSGKYKFKVTTNIQLYEGRITSHTYKLGGEYRKMLKLDAPLGVTSAFEDVMLVQEFNTDERSEDVIKFGTQRYGDCINISYKYKNNIPIKAMLPHLLYEPECAVGGFLDITEDMIKTAILYAYNDVKTIPIFEFEDDSNIDCATQSPPRKLTKPLNLAFFHIAYHGSTWYEARFNAKMMDPEKHKKYKKSLEFLTDPSKKPEFKFFLEIIENKHAEDSPQLINLEKYYNKSLTYRKFFEAIPKEERCNILYEWLDTFMKYYIFYDNRDWFIDSRRINAANPSNVQSGGSLSKNLSYYIFSYKKTSNF
jgi:hypothetical protein